MVPLLLLPLLWGGSLQEYPDYQLRVQESVTVQEGLCVHVRCSFSYPSYLWASQKTPYIYWFQGVDTPHTRRPVATNNPQRQVKSDTQGRFNLTGDPSAKDCSLRIGDARRSDEGVYYFRVERGDYVKYSYTDTPLTVRVTALTQDPDIHVPEPLKSGWPAQLTCSLPGSCEGGRPLTVSWAGAALGSLDPETLHSSVLTLTPRPQDHGTNLTCQVQLPGAQVTLERTIWLNVSFAPHNLTIGIFFSNDTALRIMEKTSSLVIWEGQALLLLCAAAGNPPAQLSWFRGSPAALNATPVSMTHTLELPQVRAEEEGVLTCQAQNSLGSQNVSLHLSVVDPPRLLSPSCSWEGEGLRCTCSSRARQAPTLRWRLGEGLLEGNHSNASLTVNSSSAGPWANSSLSLRGPLGSDLILSCEARNVYGAQSAAVLVLLPGLGAVEERRGKPLSLAEAAPAAVGGAGASALLCLCSCLLFRLVKARRKQASGGREAMDDEDPVMGTVAWGSRKKPCPDSAPDQVTPVGDDPLPGEQQELHYASFSFLGMQMREPQDQETTSTTEYSEIRASK